MSALLQVADQKLGVEEICALLTSPQVLPHLLRELIVEQVTATVDCRTEELEAAFREMAQLPQYQSLPPAHVERLIPRQLKLEKFKTANWGAMVEAEFLQHQERYDQVLFSLIQTDNLEVIQELYFRLREGETNFGEIASQYSHGPEARTNGLVGPLELYNLHPKLSHMLRISQPGQVSPPFRVDQWVVIVRLERYLPAQFDEKLRQRLVDEKFEEWMQQAIAQHAGNVRIPDVLDLPTIDLQEQAELKLPPSSPSRRRLAPVPPPPPNPKLAAANAPAPQPESPPATATPTAQSTEADSSPFADERLLDAPAAESDPSPATSPANEAIAFTPPRRLGVDLPKVTVPEMKLPEVKLPEVSFPAFQLPPLRGTLLLAILPLLLVGWTVAALLGWDAHVQALFSSPEATPIDLANPEVAQDIPPSEVALPEGAAETQPADEPLPVAPAAREPDTPSAETLAKPGQTGAAIAPTLDTSDDAVGELETAEAETEDAETPSNLLPDNVATPFHTAVNHANHAVTLIPNAARPTDWQQIAQEWRQAAQLMAMVPADHPQAELAKAKVTEYQGYLGYAEAQAQNPEHAFRIAVRHAEEAAQSSQAAQRTQDWDAVIEGWEEAIAAMKAVPVESEHYSLAQAKVIEYQGYRDTIQAIADGRPLARVSQ